jgi:hypothetical protein
VLVFSSLLLFSDRPRTHTVRSGIRLQSFKLEWQFQVLSSSMTSDLCGKRYQPRHCSGSQREYHQIIAHLCTHDDQLKQVLAGWKAAIRRGQMLCIPFSHCQAKRSCPPYSIPPKVVVSLWNPETSTRFCRDFRALLAGEYYLWINLHLLFGHG